MGSRSRRVPRGGGAGRRPGRGGGLAQVCAPQGDGLTPAQEALSRRLRQGCSRALAGAVARGPGVRGLCEAVQEAYAALDDVLRDLDFDPPVACARGCLHCCFNQVSLTPPEALFLGIHVLERFSPGEGDALAARVEALGGLIRGRSRRELGDIRHLTPCAFLRDGACSVHEARPLACRGWNSVDARACQLSVELRDPLAPIPSYALQRELAGAVQQGLLEGAAALGLEAGYLVMTRAVALMRRRGVLACAEDWLAGRPFLAAAPA